MEEILSKVESPFTKEKIRELFIKYLQFQDLDKVYEYVSGIEDEQERNGYIENLLLNTETKEEHYGQWRIMSSEDDISEEIRIYLNLKGKEKADIVQKYIETCISNGLKYKLKCNMKDGRYDEIIILSSKRDLKKNIDIISKITEDKELGQLPSMVGKYDNGIGITEDAENKLQSYTESRILNFAIALQKYIMDNPELVYKYCTEEEKRKVEFLLEDRDDRKELLDRKKQRGIDVHNEEILLNQNINDDGREAHYGIKDLIGIIKRMIADNTDVLEDIVKDYEVVSKNFNISSNYIFSKDTERELEENVR